MRRGERGTHIQIVHRQDPANDGDIDIEIRLWQLNQRPAGLAVIPVVRHRERSFDTEEAPEVLAEVGWPLDVTVRPVDLPLPMIEVLVRKHELTVALEQADDLGELPRLILADVLEHALCDDKVELHAAKLDRRFQDVLLKKVLGWLRNRYVNAMVMHI
jgi:hypothetical protein